MRGLYTANANDHLMLFLQPFVDDHLGPNFELRILGNAGIVTTDPENVKAVLSRSKVNEGQLGKEIRAQVTPYELKTTNKHRFWLWLAPPCSIPALW